jgi:hypothetical protein
MKHDGIARDSKTDPSAGGVRDAGHSGHLWAVRCLINFPPEELVELRQRAETAEEAGQLVVARHNPGAVTRVVSVAQIPDIQPGSGHHPAVAGPGQSGRCSSRTPPACGAGIGRDTWVCTKRPECSGSIGR